MAMATRAGRAFQRVRVEPDEVHATLARRMLADGYGFVYDHRRSAGSYLVDHVTGRRWLDLFGFFASSPLTHNHPKLHDRAFRERLADVALVNPSNSDVYTVEMAEAVETFARHAFPSSMPHLFLITGGAPAVENALKVAFDWKVRKNLQAGRGERGSRVIHFRDAFHGRLGYTVSLTNTDPRKYRHFPRFAWPRVPNPVATFPLEGENLRAVEEAEHGSLAAIGAAFDAHPDDVAAIIVEPIQCEGGDNHLRPEFLRELRRIADEREAMLIFDEVQTGMGVTGTWWAHQQLGVEPDVMAFGKKAQVCGVVASRRVDEVERNVFVEGSRINSTWGGSLVDMVRGQRYVEIITEDGLLENARVQGEYLLGALRDVAGRGGVATNPRGRGLLIAFDMPDAEARDRLVRDAYDAGLLILPCGARGIRLRPHLDVGRPALDEALSLLETLLRPARQAKRDRETGPVDVPVDGT